MTSKRATRTPERQAWVNMLQRCESQSSASYSRYGGRGITVCDRWRSFENFLADMGERPSGASLDRIDLDAGYTPSNCRWASRKRQARNTARTHWVTLGGAKRSFMDWCDEYGINPKTVRKRLQLGWDVECAFTTPVRI